MDRAEVAVGSFTSFVRCAGHVRYSPNCCNTVRHTRRFAEWHDAGSFIFVTAKTNAMKHKPRNAKRTSLMQLRPRHLDKIEILAKRRHYHRADQHDFMLEHYDMLFGGLRPKAKQVPSDELRKSLMILSLLDLVDERRDEIEEDDARAACST